jgi:hypothetical protein
LKQQNNEHTRHDAQCQDQFALGAEQQHGSEHEFGVKRNISGLPPNGDAGNA